ncbi:MAG: fatty-acid synthase [Oscillatoriales cyanobacterium]|nr:MAG: fatty-acid synthase [Oscillatoriales cyanobacterium]
MPRRDLYHDTVRSALIKDGWTITHDPYVLGDAELYVFADLCASKTTTTKTITLTIEIKVFGANGHTSELEKAIGQYVLYRSILRHENQPTQTYLAIPSEAYHGFFQKRAVQNLIHDEQIKLLVFNPATETIEQWKP